MPSGSAADRFAKVWNDKGIGPLPSGWRGGNQEELFRQHYVPDQYRVLDRTVKELEHRWGHYYKTNTEFKEANEAFGQKQAQFDEKQKVWGAQLDEYLNKPQLLDVGGGEQVEQSQLEGHIEGLQGSWDDQQTLDLANFKSAAAATSSPTQTQGVQWKKAPSANQKSLRRGGGSAASAMKIGGVNV